VHVCRSRGRVSADETCIQPGPATRRRTRVETTDQLALDAQRIRRLMASSLADEEEHAGDLLNLIGG